MRILHALLLSLLIVQQSAAAVVIDDFRSGSLPPTSLTAESIVQAGLPPASVIGGVRKITSSPATNGQLAIDTVAGRFEISTDNFGYFTLEYGSEAPLNIDLTADHSDAFRLSFTETLISTYIGTNKRGLYEVRVANTAGSTRSLSFAEEIFALDGSGEIVLPFSEFPSFDFRSVARISVDAGRIEAGSLIKLNSFSTTRTIPEPTSLLSGIVVVLGLATVLTREFRHGPN